MDCVSCQEEDSWGESGIGGLKIVHTIQGQAFGNNKGGKLEIIFVGVLQDLVVTSEREMAIALVTKRVQASITDHSKTLV